MTSRQDARRSIAKYNPKVSIWYNNGSIIRIKMLETEAFHHTPLALLRCGVVMTLSLGRKRPKRPFAVGLRVATA